MDLMRFTMMMMTRKPPELFTGKDLANLELEKDFSRRVQELATLYGWRVYQVPDSRRASMAGWPDLTMYRVSDQRMVLAELKREKGRLSPAQVVILDELKDLAPRLALEVHVWRPSDWDEIVSTLTRPI